MGEQPEYPKGAGKQAPEAMVSVLMTERNAREFEKKLLKPRLELAGPMLFGPDDVPTYIIGIV